MKPEAFKAELKAKVEAGQELTTEDVDLFPVLLFVTALHCHQGGACQEFPVPDG